MAKKQDTVAIGAAFIVAAAAGGIAYGVGQGGGVPLSQTSGDTKGHVQMQQQDAAEELEVVIDSGHKTVFARQKSSLLKSQTKLVNVKDSARDVQRLGDVAFEDAIGNEFAVMTFDGKGYSASTVKFTENADGVIQWTRGSFANTPLGKEVIEQGKSAVLASGVAAQRDGSAGISTVGRQPSGPSFEIGLEGM